MVEGNIKTTIQQV